MRGRGAVLFACALALLAASGCIRSTLQSTASTVDDVRMGNVDNGRRVFELNCATCHGATGVEGGVGPSLRDERIRKSYDATISWIDNPLPPMPKLYPSPLDKQEVDDVAAYVQSL